MDYFIPSDEVFVEYSVGDKVAEIMGVRPLSAGVVLNKDKFIKKNKKHDYYELIYTLNGSAWVKEELKYKRLYRGDWTLLIPGKNNEYKSITPWSFAFLRFTGRLSWFLLKESAIVRKTDNLYFKQLSKNSEMIMMKMITDSDLTGIINEVELTSNLVQLIISLCKNHASKNIQENPLEPAQKYIMNNLFKAITLPELASKANMSIPTFIRIFKQRMGFSPMNFINKLRIEQAQQIIKTYSEELKINEIAKMTGFSDPFYFSRVFKKWTKMSPLHYRKQVKKIH